MVSWVQEEEVRKSLAEAVFAACAVAEAVGLDQHGEEQTSQGKRMLRLLLLDLLSQTKKKKMKMQ